MLHVTLRVVSTIRDDVAIRSLMNPSAPPPEQTLEQPTRPRRCIYGWDLIPMLTELGHPIIFSIFPADHDIMAAVAERSNYNGTKTFWALRLKVENGIEYIYKY